MSINSLTKRLLADFSNIRSLKSELLDGYENLIWDQSYWEVLLRYSFKKNDLSLYFASLTEDRKLSFFEFAVHCMMKFVQANFTGPELPQCLDIFLGEPSFKKFNFSSMLSFNNEEINVNTKYPILLCTAKSIFENCQLSPLYNLWWILRTIIIHQQLIDELIPELLEQADDIEDKIQAINDIDDETKIALEIELAQLYNLFRNIPKVRAHINTAKNILGITYNLIGKEGKRTKHQTANIAQLTVEFNLQRDNNKLIFVDDLEIPQILDLEDDVRLNEINFKDDIQYPVLTDMEQKLLFTYIQELCIAHPCDVLYIEEIWPFIHVLLHQNNTWPVRVAVLLLRLNLEKRESRTIQRSLIQCDEIVKSFNEKTPHPLNRVCGVYGVGLQPIWKAQAQLAQLWVTTDCTKTGLDIFLKLQLWDDVIACYILLDMRHKAVEIIKRQLELSPTAKLWCLLGDTTDDVTCYEKAWDVSNKRSSRAQRQWGRFYFVRKQYKECIQHLLRSLQLNPIQPRVWFEYGYAAIETEDWQTAATAYTHYTSLDPDNFQAWNNLAKAYTKLGNKRSAHKTLHDAIRCEYNNWQVWDNLMVVSVDLAHFSDVIQAYHQILDLKKKHLDVEVLSALVYGVCNNVKDFNENPAERLMERTRELLGRIVSIYPTQGHVWELYSSLAPNALLRAQRLQRSLKGFTQLGWENNPESCLQVLYLVNKLAQTVLSDQINATDSLLNSVRLQLMSHVTTIQRKGYEETQNLLTEVNILLTKVLEKSNIARQMEITK